MSRLLTTMRGLCGYFLLAVITASALGMAVGPHRVVAAGPDFTVSPTLINRHQTVSITVTVSGGLLGFTYVFNVTVTQPDRTVVFRIVDVATDPIGGNGLTSTTFPQDYSTGASTLLDGTYQVLVKEIQPLSGTYGPKPFTVSSFIDLTVLSPNSTVIFPRGSQVVITAHATDVQGKDLPGLSANFTSPSGANISLTNLMGTGVYSQQYTIGYDDPLQWTLLATASDAWGNHGSSTENLGVDAVTLLVDPIHLVDSSGRDLTAATLNQTVYVSFQARFPDGSLVTSGSANVTLLDPNNRPKAILNATFSAARNAFFTQSGYFIRSSDPPGRWSAIIYTGYLVDAAGNTGPASPIFTSLDVSSQPFVFSAGFLASILLLGLGATGSLVVLSKKSGTGFEYFDRITGGGIPDGSLVMLYGESKSGKSILLEEMLYRRLKEDKPCIYITYELSAEEVLKNARDFKWDLDPYVESGMLTLIDNSDLMSSLDLSKTRMKLSSALALKENRGLQLFIDSMDLLFEDLDYREVKRFLSKLTEEVRKLQGSVYFSLTTSTIIKETIPEIQDIIDWSIELQTHKKGTKMERTMIVKKMKDANFREANSRFKLVRRKGMVFEVPLIRKLGRS